MDPSADDRSVTAPRPEVGRSWTLTGPEGRHAATVQRLRAGELLLLADGRGSRWTARVVGAGRDSVEVDVLDQVTVPLAPLLVTVVQALPKGERGELAVDLATEAGVDAIVPWAAARCVARWTGTDKARRGVEKWRSTARSAAKQARRPHLPTVGELADTATVVRLVAEAAGQGTAVVLHEAATAPLTELPLPRAGRLVLIVGPEGGVAPEELAAFEQAGATPARLGPEVLRSSTAAAVALGAVAALTGRWSDR
ncbi:16S rRNA (uracil(1498)-N(3))-methyltransferase [Nakamurella sp. YIM 132084]|uniref:Ribosomal RNA small subunit methyltransferase E n=1 Tax=Nakamurella leprariae TaxID=2803911 RepID=A0A939C1N4_9ACTN|nr:16S rRNA (uracil(1498)-N(3))-methyltransferase [Nakamurella leprariae]